MPEVDFFSKGDGYEVSGGDFIATPGDSNVKYFSDCKNVRITGGRYGTMDRTETQSSGETSSNATHSSTFSQDRSDRHSHSSRQRTGKTEADQQDSLSPYDRSRVRRGSGGSILAAEDQVANDPESYYTIQATPSPPTSHTVASPALRTDTTPSSNKGKGSSSSHHRAHGGRSDMGGSSSSRINTAPPSSKRSDNITKYVGANPPPPPPPPPVPPKPEEYRKGTSYTGPPPTGQDPDLNRGGSYPNPAPPPTTTGTGHTGYPSPGPSSPPSRIFYQSPAGSPQVLSKGYQPPPGSPPFPKTPPGHRQTVPFRADAAQMAYPSPELSPVVYRGHQPPPGQREYAQDFYPPQIPTTPTANLGRRHVDPPPFDMLQWSNSEPATTPSHGDSRFIGNTPPMSRSITMPTPSLHHGPTTAMTNSTSSPPYGAQYHQPPAHDGGPYNASTDYPHHGGPPSQYPTQAPHPFNYPSAQGNSYQGPSARSQERAPTFPMPDYHYRP